MANMKKENNDKDGKELSNASVDRLSCGHGTGLERKQEREEYPWTLQNSHFARVKHSSIVY